MASTSKSMWGKSKKPNMGNVASKLLPPGTKSNLPFQASSFRFSPEVQADELEMKWQHFVQRVRIHEMLKCMRSHHERLKVLREHTDLDEMLETKEREKEVVHTSEIDSIRRHQRKHRDEVTAKSSLSSASEKGEDDAQLEDEIQAEKLRQRIEMEKKQTEIMTRGIDNLFIRTQQEEEEAITQIYPPLKKVLADPKYVAKTALSMFRSRTDITEEEFEAIIELCHDEMEKQALRDAYEENRNREKYLHNADEKRRMLYAFINSRFFVQFMLVTIIVSIIGIFLLTFEKIYITYSYPLIVLDNCIIGIFVVEATFKITIYKEDYFKKPWNLLDIVIILVNFVEVCVELITKTLALSTDINTSIYFKVLKSLRALRLLRIIKFLPNLQVIVTTIFQSMLSMGSIAVLMSLFIFVFAVMGRGLFAEDSPKYFGGLWLAFVTLFQLLTLDDWFELMQNLPHKQDKPQYWLMFIYLFFYIVIENLVFLNLFVAVLVDNFQITLTETEIRKSKEALIYNDEKDAFNELFEELERKLKESNRGKMFQNEDENEYIDPAKPELTVPDYFPVGKHSREKVLLENIFKDLAALDFERFLWKRRVDIIHTVMDKAITAHRNTWTVQDNTNELELARLLKPQSSE